MGTPNHPKLDPFSIETHGDLGITHFKNPQLITWNFGTTGVNISTQSKGIINYRPLGVYPRAREVTILKLPL